MRRHLVLEEREDAGVLFREDVGTAADRLADFDHEPLETEDSAIDALCAAAVMIPEPSIVLLRGHSLLSHRKEFVAGQDAGRGRGGVGGKESSVFAEAGEQFCTPSPGPRAPLEALGRWFGD